MKQSKIQSSVPSTVVLFLFIKEREIKRRRYISPSAPPPPLKKIKVYTTALNTETEEPFKEGVGVGRGSQLLELPIVPWERCHVIRPVDAPGLGTSMITSHLMLPVCSLTSCPLIFLISLPSSPERPANSGREGSCGSLRWS